MAKTTSVLMAFALPLVLSAACERSKNGQQEQTAPGRQEPGQVQPEVEGQASSIQALSSRVDRVETEWKQTHERLRAVGTPEIEELRNKIEQQLRTARSELERMRTAAAEALPEARQALERTLETVEQDLAKAKEKAGAAAPPGE